MYNDFLHNGIQQNSLYSDFLHNGIQQNSATSCLVICAHILPFSFFHCFFIFIFNSLHGIKALMTSKDDKQSDSPKTFYTNLTDLTNPYPLESSDNPRTILVIDLLTTENYAAWSHSIRRALRAKNKLGFINGPLMKPSLATDLLMELWERCNDMLVSWIQNSINKPLRLSVAFVDDAHEIWTKLREWFSQQNEPCIYELKKSLFNLRQEFDTISIYQGKLKTIWNELVVYDPIPECNCGQLKVLVDRYQRDCVIQFLMGLSDNFSNTRDQLMLIDSLPPVKKVFSYIQQQERQYQIVSNTPEIDSVALTTCRPFGNFKNVNKPLMVSKNDRLYCSYCKIDGHTFDNYFKAGNAEILVCTHCNMSGHTAEKCYKLHGYLIGHKMHNKTQSNAVLASQTISQTEPKPEVDLEGQVFLTQGQFMSLCPCSDLKISQYLHHQLTKFNLSFHLL